MTDKVVEYLSMRVFSDVCRMINHHQDKDHEFDYYASKFKTTVRK